MLNLLKEMMNFEYDIYNAPGNEFGTKSEVTKQWSGLIGEIVSKVNEDHLIFSMGTERINRKNNYFKIHFGQRAHIGLAPLFMMSEREKVVDYTIPFYDLVGMKILMMKPVPETSLFKFLVVMEPTVWGAILGAYLFTR